MAGQKNPDYILLQMLSNNLLFYRVGVCVCLPRSGDHEYWGDNCSRVSWGGLVRVSVIRCKHNFGTLDSALGRISQKTYLSAILQFFEILSNFFL